MHTYIGYYEKGTQAIEELFITVYFALRID